MEDKKLLAAVKRLSVETGSLACLGCGWEHDCGIHGCAILRAVKEALEETEARAEEAEEALAAAVRDIEAMAAVIRARATHDTECCFLCKYDCPDDQYCPGWDDEECFVWRGKGHAVNELKRHNKAHRPGGGGALRMGDT